MKKDVSCCYIKAFFFKPLYMSLTIRLVSTLLNFVCVRGERLCKRFDLEKFSKSGFEEKFKIFLYKSESFVKIYIKTKIKKDIFYIETQFIIVVCCMQFFFHFLFFFTIMEEYIFLFEKKTIIFLHNSNT